MRRVINIALRATRAHPDRSVGRIYTHPLHHRQVNYQSVVDAAETWSVVTPAADRDAQPVLPCEFHRADNVGNVDATRDQLRVLVNHSVVEAPHIIIVRIRSPNNAAAHGRDKGVSVCVLHDILPEVAVCRLMIGAGKEDFASTKQTS
jgi:hypothetical protein